MAKNGQKRKGKGSHRVTIANIFVALRQKVINRRQLGGDRLIDKILILLLFV